MGSREFSKDMYKSPERRVKIHIGEKILKDMQDTLKFRYYIDIDHSDWQFFKEPLMIDDNGDINKPSFEERQKKSTYIIGIILDKHGKAYILRFLIGLAKVEPKIQELQPWVRDHVVHAVNTFILGAYILDKVSFPQFVSSHFDYQFMWKLCGPTHDLGYPIEIAHNINQPFADEVNNILISINSPSPMVELERYPKKLDKLCGNRDANIIIQNRLTDWALDIDLEDYYAWLRERNRTDHGVVSALAQLKIIDALYYRANPQRNYEYIEYDGFDFNQKFFDLDIVSASSALIVHNIDLNYNGFSNKISFKIAPLAFLLFVCDTFQEWDRYSENRQVYSGYDFDINCTHSSISLFVPMELEQKIFTTLNQRLSGLMVRVNERIAVS